MLGLRLIISAPLQDGITSVTGSTRKLVDSDFASMPAYWYGKHWRRTSARARTSVDRTCLFPRGLRYWYLACFPDSIIALRQGIGASLILGMANDDGIPIRGLLGNTALLVNQFLKPKARAYRLRAEAMLGNTPTSRLRSKPNVVYEATELKAIICIAKKGAPLILPKLVPRNKDRREADVWSAAGRIQEGLRTAETDVSRHLAVGLRRAQISDCSPTTRPLVSGFPQK